MDHLHLVADRKWTLAPVVVVKGAANRMAIRDENGFCPICAVLNEIDTNVSKLEAWTAAQNFLGRPLTPNEREDINDIVNAADHIVYSDLRRFLTRTLSPSVS